MTAGENKALLDPFSPVNPADEAHMQALLDEVHQQFIAAVKEGRGERLKSEEHPEVFSGLFWSGERAKELGLIDGLNSPGGVAREIVGIDEIVNYSYSRSPFEEFVRQLGVSIGEGVATQLGVSASPQLR